MLELKKNLKPAEQGFTLFEVLIAIFVVTLFITVAMQAMVFAAIFKVKAQEYAEATTWIQEDLENVKYQAENLQFPQTTLAVNAVVGASISINALNTDIKNSFTTNDTFRVGLDPTNYKITALIDVGSIRTLTTIPTLIQAQVTNAAVVSTTMCNPDPTNTNVRNLGLADRLRDTLTGSNQTGNSNSVDNPRSSGNNQTNGNPLLSKFTNKPYTLRRTTTTSNNYPHNVLQLKYEVSPGTTFDPSKVIATFDTEVIPHVAFQCS
mgnify:CR=1 FL=1